MDELWNVCVKDPEILHRKVEDSTPEECEEAIKKIREIMAANDSRNCFGLAANQVGINARACLLTIPHHYFSDKPGRHSRVTYELHNPHIIDWGGTTVNQEWCYSLQPHDSYVVQRHKEITIKDDKNGLTKLNGIPAYAAQHEIDHLNGRLISDKGAPAKEVIKGPKDMPKNAPCYCGSGKKFKRCHGK